MIISVFSCCSAPTQPQEIVMSPLQQQPQGQPAASPHPFTHTTFCSFQRQPDSGRLCFIFFHLCAPQTVPLCTVLWEFEPAEGAQNTVFVCPRNRFSKLTGFSISLRTRCVSQGDSVQRTFFNPSLRSQVASLSLHTV